MSSFGTMLPRRGRRQDGGIPQTLPPVNSVAALAAKSETYDYDPAVHSNVDMTKLETDIVRRKDEEIKALVRSLTYGEMMDLVADIWSYKRDDLALLDTSIPDLLHRWSKGIK